MKQKILYIILMITALVGGKGEAWGQDGYTRREINDITYTADKSVLKSGLSNNRITITHEYSQNKISYNTKFTIGDNINGTEAFSGLQLKSASTNTFKWEPQQHYSIFLKKIVIPFYNTITGGKIDWTASTGETKNVTGVKNESTQTFDGFNIPNNGHITLKVDNGWGRLFYIRSVTYTYTIVYYELDVVVLTSSISNANKAFNETITDATMKEWLNTAISNANTFKDACAFPNSYWNGSSVGKTPDEVTATAEKLNAITNYLIARTDANQFEIGMVPNAVYDWLHTHDQYNPNNNADDANTINTKTNDIKAAINAANATTKAYQSAWTTIKTAENSFDKTYAQETLTADIVNAKAQLELATDVNGINTALANIKEFDAFTFKPEVPSKIEEGNTLDDPASAQQDNVITYESSDNTIIEIDGTTLKALKPGTVTITATTKTGNKYYGYTTTKVFTVTHKAVILYPDKECTIEPNIVYSEITLERSFSAKIHYTLTLPFDSNISDIGGDYAAQLALVTYNKADGYTLYFQKVAEGDMMANQPYIVYAENGFKESLKWANIRVAETIDAKGVSNDQTQGWTMQGNYTPELSMSGNYGIANGLFRKGGTNSYINAYTAYFTFLGTENVRTRVAVMDEDGNTTYIGELSDLNGNAAEEVFGIDGMRLPEMRKGINIVRQKDGSVRKIVK